jgi:hypothetical protein
MVELNCVFQNTVLEIVFGIVLIFIECDKQRNIESSTIDIFF